MSQCIGTPACFSQQGINLKEKENECKMPSYHGLLSRVDQYRMSLKCQRGAELQTQICA